MIHILTFKCGDRYDYRSVNLLKRSIDFHYDKPYTFYCMTDDANGFDSDIKVIPMQDDFKYEFNSVSMLKSGFANIPDGSDVVLMDIDIEVVNDPSPIFDFKLLPKQIGFIHKWWTYPYSKGSFISGMAYRYTAGELDCFYRRFKADPELYTNKYIKFNGRAHKIDNVNIHVRGEQDFFLESAGVNNFHMNLFPSFWAENVNPEIEFNEGGTWPLSERLRKYLSYKNMSPVTPKEPILKHYTGNIERYVEKRYNVYR